MTETTCWACRRGQCSGCAANLTDFDCVCDHVTPMRQPLPEGPIANALNLEPDDADTTTSVTRSRRNKNDDAVTDQQSTGRKRAAKLYPLKNDKGEKYPCDLAGKVAGLPKYMEVQIDGCGVRPGTMANPAQARHHHDYNTLNNERSNVGLLCHSCHNLLHAKNDPFKDVIYQRIYGVKPATEDLKHANKALKSGVVGGGTIKGKEEFGL